jgi:hypothetical protein
MHRTTSLTNTAAALLEVAYRQEDQLRCGLLGREWVDARNQLAIMFAGRFDA